MADILCVSEESKEEKRNLGLELHIVEVLERHVEFTRVLLHDWACLRFREFSCTLGLQDSDVGLNFARWLESSV